MDNLANRDLPSRYCEMSNNLSVLGKVSLLRGRIAILACLLGAFVSSGCATTQFDDNAFSVQIGEKNNEGNVQMRKEKPKPTTTPKIKGNSKPSKPVQQPSSEPIETEKEKLKRIYEELSPLQQCMETGDCFYS